MAKKIIGPNSINVRLFSAIKICEKAGLPLLILSNPGFSKSSTVFLYCQITGKTLIQLRSNSTTYEEVVGYDTVKNLDGTEEHPAATRVRPHWFQNLLDADARGEQCLLFLDEITTSDSRVQAALLHLIFERKCGDEPIPESTVIISAGNYMSNLAKDLSGLMAPTMNRFIIYNLRFELSDLDAFLGHYSGSMVGRKVDFKKELYKALEEINKQELVIPDDRKFKILELIENGIKDQTKMLSTHGEKVLDINFTELDSIYEDIHETGGKVLGFITPRGLYYSVKLAYSAYQCFGKAGLQSEVFKSLLEGIIGLALSYDKKKDDVKKTMVVSDYFQVLQVIANDIEKMKNDKLPEYENFINGLINDGDKIREKFGVPELQSLINKLSELKRDPEVLSIERPVQPTAVNSLCEIVLRSSADLKQAVKVSVSGKSGLSSSTSIETEVLSGVITKWNYISELMSSMTELILNPKMGYSSEIKDLIKSTNGDLRPISFKLRALRKVACTEGGEDSSIASIIPEVKQIVTDPDKEESV